MKVKVCVVQDYPVFFDKEKTIEKIDSLTSKYAKKGTELIVFPESFVPGYPRGFTFGANVGKRTQEGRELYAKYHRNSVNINDNGTKRLEEIAKANGIYLVVGVTEKQPANGSLYCSVLFISPNSGLMGVRRKII